MTQDQTRPSEPEFELYQESGTQSQIVCPHATINPGFSLHEPVIAQQALFACKCAMLSSDQSPHMTEVGAFACKSYPMAFIYGQLQPHLGSHSNWGICFSVPYKHMRSCERQ